jgi:hypothetical protein
MTIYEKIDDLILQATKERSHYYTKSVLVECKEYIEQLEKALKTISGSSNIDESFVIAEIIKNSTKNITL